MEHSASFHENNTASTKLQHIFTCGYFRTLERLLQNSYHIYSRKKAIATNHLDGYEPKTNSSI